MRYVYEPNINWCMTSYCILTSIVQEIWALWKHYESCFFAYIKKITSKSSMDQRELVRRLCNGALAQILHDNSSNSASSSSSVGSNNDSILNTLLINTIGNLILKRKTNKSTQTDFNVQRIGKSSTKGAWLENQHLLPLYKLQPPTAPTATTSSRKNCIR